jgi:hypothetical protein
MISVRVPAALRDTSNRGSLFRYLKPMAASSSSLQAAVPAMSHPEPEEMTDTVPESSELWETCSQPISTCGSDMSDGTLNDHIAGLQSVVPYTWLPAIPASEVADEEAEITAGQRTPQWPLFGCSAAGAEVSPPFEDLLQTGMASAGVADDSTATLMQDLGLQPGGAGMEFAAPAVPPMCAREAAFTAAAAEGKVDARGKLGNWWAQALQDTPGLRERYQLLGRNYALQRTFRVNWAKDKATEMKLTRESMSRSIELDESAGSYEPLDVIVQKEGGGPAGLQAARNYVETCLKMARDGMTWRGRCLVEWNSWTKRYECAYIKKTFRSAFERTWSDRSSGTIGAPPVAAAAAAVTALAAVQDETPAKQPKGKAKAKAAAGRKRADAGEPKDEDTPEVAAKKKARKANEELFGKSTKLKSRYEAIAASLLQIRSNVEKKVAHWDFANAYLQELEDTEVALMKFQKKSSFWSDWFLSDAAGLKKSFAVEESTRELVALKDVTDKLEALDKVVKKVLAMHRACQANS